MTNYTICCIIEIVQDVTKGVTDLAWKFEAGISLCEQIADIVRGDIIRGAYAPGETFPTVRQLAAEAGVNPNTMQKALTLLEEDGLLITLSTHGRIVTEDCELIARARQEKKLSEVARIIRSLKDASFELDEFITLLKEGWKEDE